ncbi:MAG: hypothetical protein JWN25_1561 [Verrucomicrobiales bacterium]|nr:hypothetical protein [Verrucomicrobiales bacterium]
MNINEPLPQTRALRFSRYAGIYSALWKNSVIREMGFKTNFLLWMVVELLWFSLQLVFVSVIYLHTENIGTWTKWQVVMLMGCSHFIQQVFQGFFFVNCSQLPELVRTGKMDFMLLLPVNTRFVVSLRNVDLGAFFTAGSGLAVMFYAGSRMHLSLEPIVCIGFMILCAASVMIHYSIMFLLASISFWTVRAQGVIFGYYNLFNISRLPDEAFQGGFRRIFSFGLPLLLVVNVPVRFLIHKMENMWGLVLLLAMSLVWLIVSEICWRYSLKHYTSASS